MSFLLAACFAFATQDEKATPKIAEIESYAGTVELVDAKKTSRAVTKFGRRLKNSDVRDEDIVKTSAGAQAVIVFPDRSRYTLKEKSEVQILQKTLPKPTPEGNTIGRRLRVLVGNLTSEVMPSTEVRTDFETPSGSAAVRGTMLRMVVEGASLRLETFAGTVRFYNVEFATRLDVGRGQTVSIKKGSLTIEVVEDGGNPLPGDFGARHCMLTKGDHVTLNDAGANLNCDITQGTLNVDNVDTDKPFVAPKGEGVGGEDCGVKDELPTAAPIFDEVGMNGTGDADLYDQATGGDNPVGDATTAVATCETNFSSSTSSSSSSSPPPPPPPPPPMFPMTIDDFNRAPGPVGNGWVTEFGSQVISGNIVLDTIAGGGLATMSKNIGTLSTWNIQATFDYSAAFDITDVRLAVNAASPGCMLQYFPSGPGSIQISEPLGSFNTGTSVGVAAPMSNFTMDIAYNGTNLCGTISGAGLTTTTTCISTGLTWAGTLLRVGGTISSTGTLGIDNVIRNQ